MTTADWRALIEAYLEGRLSAEAFERRFVEAWRAQRARGARNPPAVEDLFTVVEAFGAEQDERSSSDPDDDEMRSAARVALRALKEEGQPQARTFDRARTREDMLRVQAHFGQIAGIGCLMTIAWLVLMVLQINFTIEQVNAQLKIGVWFSSIIGFFVAFIPVAGNIVAFFGAKDVAGWPFWVAGGVFLVLPAAMMVYGGWRWRRWREKWRRR